MRITHLLVAAACSCVGLAGCGGYDDTVVPSPDAGRPGARRRRAADVRQRRRRRHRVLRRRRRLPGRRRPSSGSRPRGKLVAGVAADTYLLGFRNPVDDQIEGFDIDMAEADREEDLRRGPGHLELKVITAADRIPLLQAGDDRHRRAQHDDQLRALAADRLLADYYDAGPEGARRRRGRRHRRRIEDLDGKRICAPAGTTSIDNIQKFAPEAIPVTADRQLRLHGAVPERRGRRRQHRRHRARRPRRPGPLRRGARHRPFLTQEPYGIGVNEDNVDLVRFINADARGHAPRRPWQASYDKWLEPALGVPGKQPKPEYGR